MSSIKFSLDVNKCSQLYGGFNIATCAILSSFYPSKTFNSSEYFTRILYLFMLQDELAHIIGAYKTLYGKDLTKDAEAKFSENMKKLVFPRLKKGTLLLVVLVEIGGWDVLQATHFYCTCVILRHRLKQNAKGET